MKLGYSPYSLPLRAAPNAKTGANFVEGILVRRDGGYACLQTWPTLGEKPWQDEWASICRGDWTSPIARRLDACLSLDSVAREAGRDLFEGLRMPQSYLSVGFSDSEEAVIEADRLGFRGGKLKGGGELRLFTERLERLHQLLPEWSWRVDFNGTLEPGVFTEWVEGLSNGLRKAISYIEDPCPSFVPWPDLPGLRLAEDRCVDQAGRSHIQVLKPAVEDWRDCDPDLELVLTSNFQHPLGMLFDWYEAAQALQQGRRLLCCGLVTQHIFEPNPWSEALGALSPNPTLARGAGLGLGKLLEHVEWRAV